MLYTKHAKSPEGTFAYNTKGWLINSTFKFKLERQNKEKLDLQVEQQHNALATKRDTKSEKSLLNALHSVEKLKLITRFENKRREPNIP